MAAKPLSFDVGDFVVYPKHGVGRVVELQSTEIAGTLLISTSCGSKKSA